MILELIVFLPVSLPLNKLHTWKQHLNYVKRLVNTYSPVLGKHVKYERFFHKQLQQEKLYAIKRGVETWSNIPFVFKRNYYEKNQRIEVTTWLRETGVLALQYKLRLSYQVQNLQDYTLMLHRRFKRLKQRLESQELQILNAIFKLNTSFSAFTYPYYKARPVYTVFGEPENTAEFRLLKEWIHQDLTILGGMRHPQTRVRGTDIRYHSRGLHALFQYDTQQTKRGRQLLKRGVLNAIHLANGIPALLNATQIQLKKQQTQNHLKETWKWDVLIHYLNPLILEGKTTETTLLVKGVQRSWFIAVDRMIRLREAYLDFFMQLLNTTSNPHLHLPVIAHSLLTLPSAITTSIPRLPVITIPKNHETKLEQRILQILQKHEQKLLSNDQSLDLKYKRGLTITAIMKELNLKNGRKTRNVKQILEQLERIGHVQWQPYLGVGRKKNSKMYFLSQNYTDILQNYTTILEIKLLKPMNRLIIESNFNTKLGTT